MNKCCMCSAVKNVGRFLPKIVTNMKTLGTVFDEYVMVFFYDHSDDDTWHVLEELKQYNNNIVIINNPQPLSSAAPRTYKIAHARNSLLNAIRNSYKHYEYFIMMDAKIVQNPVGDVPKYVFNNAIWEDFYFARVAVF